MQSCEANSIQQERSLKHLKSQTLISLICPYHFLWCKKGQRIWNFADHDFELMTLQELHKAVCLNEI